MLICDPIKCTGCSSCVAICAKNAISMVPDDHGFPHPVINHSICTSCGFCQRTCPQNQAMPLSEKQSVFAGLSFDDELREASSSGGIFSELANSVLRKEGLVFGATYDEDLNVHHIGISSVADLHRLRGSKYVQSCIGTTYMEAKVALLQGKQVLFSGTPCQIAGLYAFLGKKYCNLLTVDILCHGVPSPTVFRTFLSSLQKQFNSPIVNISFRSKIPGWKNYTTQIVLQDGTKKQLPFNSFMTGFLSNIYLRESCYQCRYATTNRVGDITLGDYWSYQESAPEHIENDDRGISLIICSTDKGHAALANLHRKLSLANRTLSDAKRGNAILDHPSKKSISTDSFWDDFPTTPWDILVDKYFPSHSSSKDYISPEDRKYYAIPYRKRHRRHLIHCCKIKMLNKLRRK